MLCLRLLTICGTIVLQSFGDHVTVDQLANLELIYTTVSYDVKDGLNAFNSTVTLSNDGDTELHSDTEDVNIYACFIRLIVGSDSTDGVELDSDSDGKVTAHHLDGCAHKLTFHAPFALPETRSVQIYMTQQFWLVAYTDVMPNWYIQIGDGVPQVIRSTMKDQTNFVSPFTTQEQQMRTASDRILPWTPEERLARFQLSRDHVDESKLGNRLVPSLATPFEADSGEMIGPFADLSEISMTFVEDAELSRDSHTIQISSNGSVKITASSMQSYILSQSTVQQLLERHGGMLPVGVLRDNQPRFGHRGFSLDISRHFRTKETIKRHLDLMWRYKLNILHLHFTDDESWAVEIEGLPELTEIGAKQCFDLEACATYPQVGVEVNQENQFLTKQDYIDIVSYAGSKGIEVIPEVDLPGHATAAIQAMRIRYQRDSTDDYRLHDPNDTAEYLTVQYFTRSAMNPCVNSSYDFIQLVAETLVSYHEQAGQPLRVLHLGGDEVPATAWDESAVCQEVLEAAVFDGGEANYLKKMMLSRMGDIASSLNVSLAFWEDGLISRDITNTPYMKDDIFPSDIDVYAYTWQTVWEWGGGSRPYNMANSGFKVVMTPATRFYLDHAQEPNSRERGYYWARRYTDLIRPFAFRFNNFYANIDGKNNMGFPMFENVFCGRADRCPALTRPENIVGGEAIIFSETIFTQDDMDNNVWPRLMAIAERLWTEAEWEKLDGEFPDGLTEDFSSFRSILEKYELPYLDEMRVKYHLSPPAFSVEENEDGSYKLSDFTTEFTTQKVWMKDEGVQKMLDSSETISYTPGKTIYFSSSTHDGSRFSYEIAFSRTPAEPAEPAEPAGTGSGVQLSSHPLTFLLVVFVSRFLECC